MIEKFSKLRVKYIEVVSKNNPENDKENIGRWFDKVIIPLVTIIFLAVGIAYTFLVIWVYNTLGFIGLYPFIVVPKLIKYFKENK